MVEVIVPTEAAAERTATGFDTTLLLRTSAERLNFPIQAALDALIYSKLFATSAGVKQTAEASLV